MAWALRSRNLCAKFDYDDSYPYTAMLQEQVDPEVHPDTEHVEHEADLAGDLALECCDLAGVRRLVGSSGEGEVVRARRVGRGDL